jgi:hypothetical protein
MTSKTAHNNTNYLCVLSRSVGLTTLSFNRTFSVTYCSQIKGFWLVQFPSIFDICNASAALRRFPKKIMGPSCVLK